MDIELSNERRLLLQLLENYSSIGIEFLNHDVQLENFDHGTCTGGSMGLLVLTALCGRH